MPDESEVVTVGRFAEAPAGTEAVTVPTQRCARSNARVGLRSADDWSHVRSVQQGQTAAFEHIYRAYAGSVFGYLCSLTRDPLLAQDLTSETFVKALRSIRTVRDQGKPLRAWLMTIARNLAVDYAKSLRSRNVVPVGAFVEADVPEPGMTPEEYAIHGEFARELHALLRTLSADQRTCLLLRYFAGLSVADTASLMNRNGAAVRAIQHRAIRRLEHLILDEGTVSCRAA